MMKLNSDLREGGITPVDFHCHGVGPFDFTAVGAIDLEAIEAILSARQQRSVLTLYLPKSSFGSFLELMDVFDRGRKENKYQHIAGLALEGPLLASHGGTPEMGVWLPSRLQWEALAACGKKGLVYVIYSPDAPLKDSNFYYEKGVPDIAWIAETLLAGGVLPAPGHFVKSDPKESARQLQRMFDVVTSWGHGPTITDHLYNDMPHNFKHAWRTPQEKMRREKELRQLQLDTWNFSNLEEKLGLVPAVMMRSAKEGVVKICQNFDGEHVDLAVVKKTVELIGSGNLLLMTDSIESKFLAGRNLHLHDDSGLLYQDDDIVAAGSTGIFEQIKNMRLIGLEGKEINNIINKTPSNVLSQRENYVLKNKSVETVS